MIDPNTIKSICEAAGAAIMKVYAQDFTVTLKDDASPFTEADQQSNEIITRLLTEAHPDIPIISEEMATQVEYETRKKWPRFWLVDPLDGSKEFIKKNGQFCVIISLIEHNEPVFGMMYSPVSKEAYYAIKGQGAFKIINDDTLALPLTHSPAGVANIIGSLSHSSPEFDTYVNQQKKLGVDVNVVQIGSGLKFCYVAEGKADMYPRFVPTMEWDTAAGQLLVEECGKTMIDNITNERMIYNKVSLKNNGFIVS